MPWSSGKSFAERHNHKLKGGAADKAKEVANAIMKAITKAKRRVTLSICGLGMLDETEVESLPGRAIEARDAGYAPADPTQAPIEPNPYAPGSYAVNPEQEQERREVVADCFRRAESLGISSVFTQSVHKAYGTDIDSLTVEQLGELQGRLIKKEQANLQPKTSTAA